MKWFKSRTFWMIAGMFVINGIGGIKDQIPAEFLPYVNGLLAIAAMYFRAHTRIK